MLKKIVLWIGAILLVNAVVFIIYPNLFKRPQEQIDKSIAVLPFTNPGGNTDEEYFCEGVSEELLNLLSKFPELKVIGRTSSFAFAGKQEDVREIGKKLGVAHLLTGSLERNEDGIRITAQLVKASDGSSLWEQRYEGAPEEIFNIQDEISADVVRHLNLKLLPESAKSDVMNVKAYELMLQGRFENERSTAVSGFRSINLFQQALTLEPNSSKLWGMLANVYAVRAQQALSRKQTDSLTTLASTAAQKSIALNPARPDGHAALAYLALFYDWDVAKAKAEADKALILDPANPQAFFTMSEVQRTMGDIEGAINSIRKAMVLDPLNVNLHVALSNRLLYLGRIEEAWQEINLAYELNPKRTAIHYLMARLYIMKNDPVKAFDEIQREDDAGWHMYGLPIVLFEKKLLKASDAALANLISKRGDDRSLRVAEIYAWRGETDKAFEWLELARINHDQTLYQSIKSNPWLKKIEGDSRYDEFLAKLNLPH